jgi:PAS domain S-box-containing protein
MTVGNREMERLLGVKDQDPMSLRMRVRWLQRALPLGIILIVLAYEIIFELLLHDVVPSGARFGIEILIFGVFGAAVTWFALEWVQQRVAEEAQRESTAQSRERQLAAITANSADAILLLDNDGVIQAWNRGAELIFGYSAPEVIGKHFRMLLPEALRASGELDHISDEMAAHGYIRDYVTQRVAKDGHTIVVELTRTLLHDESGQIIGSSAILRDVTDRERAEAEILELNRHLEALVAQRTQELSEANRGLRWQQRELEKANAELQQLDKLKSEFVSLVSHELRAPLTNISGSIQLLLEGDHSRLGREEREILTLANEQVDRLARLVRGILNVSRIEAGQMQFAPQAFDLLSLTDKSLSQWSTCDPTHRYRGPSARNLPSVWADRDRTEEVLTNVIDNAAKYSAEGTEIRVEAQVVNDKMVVSVSDEGEGIPSEEMAKLFNKFQRVERGDARQTYGYGLGLYISRKFIEAMGGTLWGESQPGQGSTFSFSLPLAGHSMLTAREKSASRPA